MNTVELDDLLLHAKAHGEYVLHVPPDGWELVREREPELTPHYTERVALRDKIFEAHTGGCTKEAALDLAHAARVLGIAEEPMVSKRLYEIARALP